MTPIKLAQKWFKEYGISAHIEKDRLYIRVSDLNIEVSKGEIEYRAQQCIDLELTK